MHNEMINNGMQNSIKEKGTRHRRTQAGDSVYNIGIGVDAAEKQGRFKIGILTLQWHIQPWHIHESDVAFAEDLGNNDDAVSEVTSPVRTFAIWSTANRQRRANANIT